MNTKSQVVLLCVAVTLVAAVITSPAHAVDLPVFSTFDDDVVGQPPTTGGLDQPTAIYPLGTNTSVLVQTGENGLDTQPAVITLEEPFSEGNFAGFYYGFDALSSGPLRVEATVSVNRLMAHGIFLQTTVSSYSTVATRLVLGGTGNIIAGAQTVGTYTPNSPFRVRVDIDLDSKTWSVAIDNELDGFDDDEPVTNLQYVNDPEEVPYVSSVLPCLLVSPSLESGTASIAYDDIVIYQPYIYVSPLTWDFGDVELGKNSSVFLTISNMGNSDLTVDSLDFTTGSDLEFAIELPSTPPLTIAPDGSVDIEVVFTPSTEQCYWADLEIVSDDAYKPVVTVELDGCGVVTEIPPSKQIAEIIEFIKDSQENGSLVGVGSQPDKKIDVLVKMLEAVKDLTLIKAVDLEKACQQLSIILRKCDGLDTPPDFVVDGDDSEATAALAGMIQDLMDDLGCE